MSLLFMNIFIYVYQDDVFAYVLAWVLGLDSKKSCEHYSCLLLHITCWYFKTLALIWSPAVSQCHLHGCDYGNYSCVTVYGRSARFNLRKKEITMPEALVWFHYLKVWVGVGVGQPGRPWVLLVLEGPVENLRYGTEIEGTHCRCGNAVSESQEEKKRRRDPAQGDEKMMDERGRETMISIRRTTFRKRTPWSWECVGICRLVSVFMSTLLYCLHQHRKSNTGWRRKDAAVSGRHYWIINPAIGHN